MPEPADAVHVSDTFAVPAVAVTSGAAGADSMDATVILLVILFDPILAVSVAVPMVKALRVTVVALLLAGPVRETMVGSEIVHTASPVILDGEEVEVAVDDVPEDADDFLVPKRDSVLVSPTNIEGFSSEKLSVVSLLPTLDAPVASTLVFKSQDVTATTG